MSFGYSVSDALLLSQLAWNAIQNSRKACGEHDGLTREVSALHVVLRRLEQELKKPESPINVGASGDTCKQELRVIMVDCGKVLRVLGKILDKYNALSEKERSGRKLWQRVRFGNSEMTDLGDLRSKIILYTSSITLYLNMVSMGTVGRIEQEMNKSGGILKEIQLAINGIITQFISRNNYEGSVFTDDADDDKAVWREFRRELRQDGFTSSLLHKHKHLILDYIKELGSRGLLDDQDPHEVELEGPDPVAGSVASMGTKLSDAFSSKPSEVDIPTVSLEHSKDSQPDVARIQTTSTTETATNPSTGVPAIEVDGPSKRQRNSDNRVDLEGDKETSDDAVCYNERLLPSWMHKLRTENEDRKHNLGQGRKHLLQQIEVEEEDEHVGGCEVGNKEGVTQVHVPHAHEDDANEDNQTAELASADLTSPTIVDELKGLIMGAAEYLVHDDGGSRLMKGNESHNGLEDAREQRTSDRRAEQRKRRKREASTVQALSRHQSEKRNKDKISSLTTKKFATWTEFTRSNPH